MKSVEKILEMLCVILTVVFFGAVAVMVLCQAVLSGNDERRNVCVLF